MFSLVTSLYNRYYYGANWQQAQIIQALFAMNLDKKRYKKFRQAVISLQRRFRARVVAKKLAIRKVASKLVDNIIENAVAELAKRRQQERVAQLEAIKKMATEDPLKSTTSTPTNTSNNHPYTQKRDLIFDIRRHNRVTGKSFQFYNPMHFKPKPSFRGTFAGSAFRHISTRYPATPRPLFKPEYPRKPWQVNPNTLLNRNNTVKTYVNSSTQTDSSSFRKPVMVDKATQTLQIGYYYPYLNSKQIADLMYKKQN